jgi:hypothetical protein
MLFCVVTPCRSVVVESVSEALAASSFYPKYGGRRWYNTEDHNSILDFFLEYKAHLNVNVSIIHEFRFLQSAQ